jgi:uncharacterized membrane protein YgdD (TMEM256/DUF423 family)
MGPRWILIAASISGFFGVAVGAFGAHGLPARLKASGLDESVIAKKLDQCEIGVRYQMIHTVVIVALGLSSLTRDRRLARAACGMFFAGILFFSGGLYSIAFLNFLGHWSIVPMGGLMFLTGWLLLGCLAFVTGSTVSLVDSNPSP